MFHHKIKQKLKACEQEKVELQGVVQAMHRSMAMIMFTPLGEILDANENFLDVVGFSLADLKGQHHRLLVPEEIQKSADYQRFWSKLAQGEYFQDRFLRQDVQGNSVWLEASYNPIFDENGQVIKVVKFATDITAQVEQEVKISGKLDAIDNSMAVIEFDLEGHILDANDNFCQAMGYDLSEIKGQHHRLFVEPGYAESQAYKSFWQDLNKGEAQIGTYERFDKNHNAIWLEANYNPVYNQKGELVSFVKFATDVSTNKSTLMLTTVVADAVSVLDEFSQGNISARMKNHLDVDNKTMFDDSVARLSQGFEVVADRLSEVVSTAMDASKTVSAAAQEVAEGSASLNQQVQEQAAALEETSATMEEMNSAVQNNTDNAQQTAKVALEVQLKAEEGANVMQQTIDAMNAIQASSHKIAEIVSLIDGIAFQTNLLALNAAVEAARAGDHGRGFAVVAGEVRALAQKSAEAARDIKQLIEESVERIDTGTDLASSSGEVLQGIHQSVDRVAEMIEQIATASVQQAQGINQVRQSIAQIESVTQQNAALVEETNASSESLSHQSQILQKDMSFFTVSPQLEAPETTMNETGYLHRIA
ncbi:methyl-accepting chemotaxis protein [Hydrogenovibrio sp. 3SP14C1]|uniref:methyl-accepting chemotaxis protein n=1 Tax=Hydrogenovibrio sp. 3SP14C1 TaxID=3038774 RepID=UPI002416891A|nr:methyl-accepting chemotaxis protein [Hydrogenovibrio sp. 3SP14C1]MDG4811432.1 methyl-accepting chemotaxis protein [Hydrogenovibrio sp. 3SP14C1]